MYKLSECLWELNKNLASKINKTKGDKKKITVSRLHKIDNGSTLKAFADIVINEQVLIKSVQVLSGEDDNLFVSMPKQKAKNDKWYEAVSLLDEDIKEDLQVVVLEAYNFEA